MDGCLRRQDKTKTILFYPAAEGILSILFFIFVPIYNTLPYKPILFPDSGSLTALL